MKNRKYFKIVLNSPVTLSFASLCLAAFILGVVTGGRTDALLFSVYRSSPGAFWTYPRFIFHVFGHGSVSHLTGNLMLFLVLGPILEEKYGSPFLIRVILVTAIVTEVVHYIFFPGSALMGASGVVFAFILLASTAGIREREIPLTFILVVILYIGEQIYNGLFASDNISQITHIIGGFVGAAFGYYGRRER